MYPRTISLQDIVQDIFTLDVNIPAAEQFIAAPVQHYVLQDDIVKPEVQFEITLPDIDTIGTLPVQDPDGPSMSKVQKFCCEQDKKRPPPRQHRNMLNTFLIGCQMLNLKFVQLNIFHHLYLIIILHNI